MSDLSLIRRDLRMRIYYGRNLIATQFVLFLIITSFYVIVFEYNNFSQQMEWISIERFWSGFSEKSLELFKQSGTFQIPYVWLFFQLFYLLSIRTFFLIDLTSSSGVIITRTGIRKFVFSKVISLFLYTVLYVSICMTFILLVSFVQYSLFKVKLSFFTEWDIYLLFYLFLILGLFLEALIFEVLSILLEEIITFITWFCFLILSFFSKNPLLIGNYTMFSRWNESLVFIDNLFLIGIWI